MIKYDLNTINDWNFGDDNIIKVYMNNAVCYYKITGGGDTPTAQTPCFAVVDDISQYSDTEFEDVFNKADNKWYKLNNLNQYEEYGVYGSGRTSCEGSASRLPVGYTEVEYIENTSTAYIDTGFKPNQNTKILITTQCVTSTSGGRQIGAGGYDKANAIQFDYETGAQGTLHISWGTTAGWTTYSSCVGDYNVHTYEWDGNVFYRDKGKQNQFSATTAYGTYQCTDNLGIFTRYQNGSGGGSSECFIGKVFDFKMYDNSTLVRDLVPAKRDSDDKYGMYDLVTNTFYLSPNNIDFIGGEPVTPTECVTTYDGKLTIDTESTPQPSRLPDGYTEVEYIRQNSNYDAYINTGVILFDNTSNTYTVTTKLASEFHSNLGCATIISCERVNSPYDGLGYRYKCSSTVDQLEFFGGNPNYSSSSIDNGDGTRTITFTSTGNSSFTTDVPLSYMAAFSSTTYGANASWRHSDSTIYSATVVKNGVTVRDFVPAKRDSDDKYGLYDLITDTFYTSPNGNNFSGGSEVIPPPITTTYEYMYSGGSWINVGEVSGSTIIIKSPEYIEKDSSHNGKINLDYVWKTNSKMQFKFYSTNNGGGAMIGEDGTPDNNDCRMFFASTTAYFDWGSSRISWSSNGRTNTLYEYEYGNYYIKNMVTSTSKTGSTISTSRTNTLYLGYGGTDRFRTYYLKFYDGDTLVKDFIPWTDTNGNYGLYEKVSNTIYSATSGSFTASSVWNDVEVGGGYEYPLEYVVREDPPNNLTFSSMTEAEAYECPWVGMSATIDGDRYVFSGDSQSGYEWVYNPSRLPIGYTEVEYVQNTGTSYFNTNFVPNQDTRVVMQYQMVTDSGAGRLWGAGAWNSATGIQPNYEGGYLGISWLGKTSWTRYNNFPADYNKHLLDLNKNYLYLDETLVGSNTYTTRTASDPIGVFTYIGSGRPSSSSYWGQEHFKGKMYSFKVYDNGTLVRDLVPCIRDNDNTVGAYDIVNDVFYTVPSGYTTDKLVAGNPV